jgi:hypothetical protein
MSTVFASARADRVARAARIAGAALAAVQLINAVPSLAAEKAHSHGDARLDVAIEATSLTLQFSSPLDNLVGFERAPRNDRERARADAAITRLEAAEAIFKIDPSAQCRLAKVQLSSAALGLGKPEPAGQDAGHADLDGNYAFTCADATKARFIDVGLFEFKRLHRIDVQVAGPAGQLKRRLTPSARRLSLDK